MNSNQSLPRNPWIATATGIAFDLVQPQKEMIDWRDIAISLGQLCRWTGHTTRFYSVAEHATRVAELVKCWLPGDDAARLYALLHDAHEAYIGDISIPLKIAISRFTSKIGAEAWIPIGERLAAPIDRVIFPAFGLEPDMPDYIASAIHLADQKLLAAEKHGLMPFSPDWGVCLPIPDGDFDAPMEPAEAQCHFATQLCLVAKKLPQGSDEPATPSEASDWISHASSTAREAWLRKGYGAGRAAGNATMEKARIVQDAAAEELLATVAPITEIGLPTIVGINNAGFREAAMLLQALRDLVIQIEPGESISDAAARQREPRI